MYFVYENWRAEKKAIVHNSECMFCNNGSGTGRNTLGEQNGKWYGPFDSYEDAREMGNSLEDREVKDCRFCIK